MIVDPLAAAGVVAERFGWARPTSMVLAGDGAMGRIWRLDIDTDSYAVKELYWSTDLEAEEAAVTRQVPFCEKARAAGIAAPENLRTDSGQYVIALPEELGGRLIRAYEWIDGRPITSADAGGSAWAGQTEAIIEGLGVPPGDQEVDKWFYRAPSVEDWAPLADRCEAAGQPWADQLRRAIPEFLALGEWVRPHDADELIITHTDFQRQNVLLDHDGRFVLLDWDDAGPANRSRALGQLINNWHIHDNVVDHEGIRQTLRGYRDAGGTAKITDVSDLGDAICGYLNYVGGQADLSLDRTQPIAVWTDAGRRMPKLLQPPQLATLEDAVRSAVA